MKTKISIKQILAAAIWLVLLVGFIVAHAHGQKPFEITRACGSTTNRAAVSLTATGNINLQPCGAGGLVYKGVTIGTIFDNLAGLPQGAVPYWTGTSFQNSAYSYNSLLSRAVMTNGLDLSLNSAFGLNLTMAPSQGAAPFLIKNSGAATVFQIDANGAVFASPGSTTVPSIAAQGFSGTGISLRGTSDVSVIASSTAVANWTASNQNMGGSYQVCWNSGASAYAAGCDVGLQRNAAGVIKFTNGSAGVGGFFTGAVQFDRTITPIGTTGSQTINKAAGTVNIAAGAGSATVTNGAVTSSSIVLATVQTNDATCALKSIVPAAGSFTVTMTANCTAATAVGWLVTN